MLMSWDPAARELQYVEVNGGAGGTLERLVIGELSAADVTEALAGVTLPRLVTELVSVDGDVLLGDVRTPAVRCMIRQAGSPGARRFVLSPKGSRKPLAEIPARQLGFDDDALAGAAQTLEYLYAAGLTPPGCWLGCEGGIKHWIANRRRLADRERERQKMAARFVNPYTFVPFPERISRGNPAGHHMLAEGHLSGTLTVTWTFTSPFQAPEGQSGMTALRLPGSSVKGAVRSLHETLAGGCLRVFDEDYIPSYRDQAAVRPGDWTMAVVQEHTEDGQPLTVRLCEDVCWVPAQKLRGACGPRLATGSQVSLTGVPKELNSLQRKELADDGTVSAGGDWVVLVTSKGTRLEKTKSGKEGAFFLACGQVGTREAEVTEAAWRAFQRAVAGTEDVRLARREDSRRARQGARGQDRAEQKQPTSVVEFDGQRIGYRRVVTGRLWAGDVLWAHTSSPGPGPVTVGELSLAAVWRHPGWQPDAQGHSDPGKWAAHQRVPENLLACRRPDELCPSCRIFGSVDVQARGRDDPAQQHAYAGHVRFGDACSPEPVGLQQIWRAPLAAPRPGAGQFYLAYDDTSSAAEERKPTREWGSDPDVPQLRRLRGRKFYWHADPERRSLPRHKARQHQIPDERDRDKSLTKQRWIAAPGTTLTQRVSFDNLAPADLGGLLAALDPGRVLDAGRDSLRLHLGGGKPLGLGSCTAAISELKVWDAVSRYGDAPQAPPEQDAYVQAFRDSCLPEVAGTWPALAAVLAEREKEAPYIWYPPGAFWAAQSRDDFDKPFAFFTASSGMYLAERGPRELIPLPDPRDEDQSLRILRRDDIK